MTRETSTLHTERLVLHTAMQRPSALSDMPLAAQHFASEQHALIWETLQALALDGKPSDGVTVGEVLDRAGHRGAMSLALEIAGASELYPSSSPRYHADLLLDAWRNREAARVAGDLLVATRSREDGAIDAAIASLMALHVEAGQFEHTARSALSAAWSQVEAAALRGGALVGIPTGLQELDDSLGGLHDSDLIVIGARPAMGKTGLLLQMTLAGSEAGPVGLISGEQPHEQVGMRWLAAGSRVSLGRLRSAAIGEGDWGPISGVVADMGNRAIRIYDRSSPDIAEVARIARRWKQQHGIKALYVDYLQRIEVQSDAPKHERVGMVARALKNLARDLRIPVVALAQVSRKVEERTNQRPQMGDLADSSEIEKEADQIITLWRDISDPRAAFANAELNVVKNRHGNIGTVSCLWHGASTSFVHEARERSAA